MSAGTHDAQLMRCSLFWQAGSVRTSAREGRARERDNDDMTGEDPCGHGLLPAERHAQWHPSAASLGLHSPLGPPRPGCGGAGELGECCCVAPPGAAVHASSTPLTATAGGPDRCASAASSAAASAAVAGEAAGW